jgi:hypothetical protein
MIGLLWYFSTIVAAYVYLLGSRLGNLITPTEAVFAAIPVGTIGGAWVVYFVASLISNLGCVRRRRRSRGGGRVQQYVEGLVTLGMRVPACRAARKAALLHSGWRWQAFPTAAAPLTRPRTRPAPTPTPSAGTKP